MRFGPLPEDAKRKVAEHHRGIVYAEDRVRSAVIGRYAPRPKITREELTSLYIDQALTQKAIAEHFGVRPAAIKTQIKLHGLVLTEAQRALRIREGRHIHWKGGDAEVNGYRLSMQRDHPNATKQGRVCAHRLVVEAFIGRHLSKAEEVHHLNFIRGDNRIENLVLFPTNADHSRFHQWTQHVGAFYLGILTEEPAPLTYPSPILFRGRWVSEIKIAMFWNHGIEAVA